MQSMKKPNWLKVRYNERSTEEVALLMRQLSLNTVCKEANCPNLGECYRKNTATFMILGSQCTRNCRFCNVSFGEAERVDEREPEKVAEAVASLGLKHVVITSVTRDDLPDEGASHFAKTIRAVRERSRQVSIEVLIPDMHARPENLDIILEAAPDVLNHNMETVQRLYPAVRPQAEYQRSLRVLEYCKESKKNLIVKTGIMVGLGEREEEVIKLMEDVRAKGCDILTIGQYLRPTQEHIPLAEYVTPQQFERYRRIGMEKGFAYVASSPLVRSSYQAAEAIQAVKRTIL
ncbi:MAG: lipoyl synthase [Peptostreptococcaceae bacterium]|nr:lipoyl synthase [Peptostreptococcaceae bacterium]